MQSPSTPPRRTNNTNPPNVKEEREQAKQAAKRFRAELGDPNQMNNARVENLTFAMNNLSLSISRTNAS